ncbi:ParB N-terminal domain-containing protein [Streptomyces roseirectus]|uniref:ParB N-terminal domain-containing protein n=2 Tax=Streptomyces roseirectus TaxID=2768066 RepID=A0A7H0ITL3_9ACTN|nr:ParB N-terminal domain-containing protein [Streptomyces roseirectus]QNP76129.1 ParB N-terminal domain-containing protein [Streptomyces roseirectus]
MGSDPGTLKLANDSAEAESEFAARRAAPARVPISSLRPADSPRLTGENPEHVELLAMARDLPPILVQRSTMRVIDGMHRVRAARCRGEESIAVTFFEGDDSEAFLRAVDANLRHGLPLSLADREAAARRILAAYPRWSDRTVAVRAGLSHTTVGAIRRRFGVPAAAEGGRVGRDGRVRPVDGTSGRVRASEVIARNPDAPLRAIAREAGVSTGTARDVRERLRAGRDPVPGARRAAAREPAPPSGGPATSPRRAADNAPGADWRSVLSSLSRDPAVRYAENGRAFVRWVDGHAIEPVEWCELIDAVPPHWRDSVAELARSCAGAWLEFARELEQRATAKSGHGVA